MNIHGESNSPGRVVHPGPIVGIPFDVRGVEGPSDEPAFDLKAYFHTL
jgi:hypothetical protein